jgi:uncharacterized membrane protein
LLNPLGQLSAIPALPLISYKSQRLRRATVLECAANAPQITLFELRGSMMLGRLATIAAVAYGGVKLARNMKGSSPASGGLSEVETSVEINVPVRTAYDQWTQFEEFPRFMDSVQQVHQIDDTHLHWKAKVGGKAKEWRAEITQQIPDQRIAWRSTSGPRNMGVVTFDKIGEGRTRVTLRMVYAPESLDERIGDAMGAMRLEAERNLNKFKNLVESRGQETGAWRSAVEGGQVQH